MMVDLHILRNILDIGSLSFLISLMKIFYQKGLLIKCSGFRGSEPQAEEAVKLICETGGVAVLAHPWALKNPVTIVRRLKDAGLHGIEVYRSDGKLAGIQFAA